MLENWPKEGVHVGSVAFQEFDSKQLGDDLHEHDCVEICFVTQGSGDWQIGATLGRFRAGSLLLCPPRTLHAWRSDLPVRSPENASGIVLRFRREILAGALLGVPEMGSLVRLREAMSQPLEFAVSDRDRMRARLRSVDRAQGVLKVARLLVALDLIAGLDFKQIPQPEGDKGGMNGRDLARLETVKRLVEERFREELSRAEAAHLLNLDEASFSRFFRRGFGTSFVDFVASFRVRHAAALLGNRRDLSLSEIAEQSGFGSVTSFHRQFRKRLGTTPDSYRKAANREFLAP